MSDSIVIAFEKGVEAEKVRENLVQMQKDHLIDIEDAAEAVIQPSLSKDVDAQLKAALSQGLEQPTGPYFGQWAKKQSSMF